jgi:hypothetical protein
MCYNSQVIFKVWCSFVFECEAKVLTKAYKSNFWYRKSSIIDHMCEWLVLHCLKTSDIYKKFDSYIFIVLFFGENVLVC